MADRLVLTLLNRGQIQKRDFRTTDGGAVLLTDDARKMVSIAWQERKKDNVAYPALSTDVPIGLLPALQARVLARVLRGDAEAYLPYLAR